MTSPGRSPRTIDSVLRPPACGRPGRAGMTLIEILLVLALLVMLASLVAITMGQGQERHRFADAANRFETVVRMCRATAQNENRRFRIEFGDAEGNVEFDTPTPIRVMWEPEHLTDPGVFKPYPLATWQSYVPSEELRVLRCRHIGASAYRTVSSLVGGSEEEDEEALQSITFYPDGWSDSALVELAPLEFDSRLRVAIRMDGDSGNVRSLTLGQTELEENHAEVEEGTYESLGEEGN